MRSDYGVVLTLDGTQGDKLSRGKTLMRYNRNATDASLLINENKKKKPSVKRARCERGFPRIQEGGFKCTWSQ